MLDFLEKKISAPILTASASASALAVLAAVRLRPLCKSAMTMAMFVAVAISAGAKAAVAVGVFFRRRDSSLSTSDAIRRDHVPDLPPRSMEWIRLTNSFPKSYWSDRHAVVAARNHI